MLLADPELEKQITIFSEEICKLDKNLSNGILDESIRDSIIAEWYGMNEINLIDEKLISYIFLNRIIKIVEANNLSYSFRCIFISRTQLCTFLMLTFIYFFTI